MFWWIDIPPKCAPGISWFYHKKYMVCQNFPQIVGGTPINVFNWIVHYSVGGNPPHHVDYPRNYFAAFPPTFRGAFSHSVLAASDCKSHAVDRRSE